MAKDLYLTLEDKPGEAARLGEALGAAGVNIEGLCAMADGGRSTVHILVDDGARARTALEGAGITVDRETEVLVSPPLREEWVATPGGFGRMARALADADVNISFAYVAGDSRFVLSTSDDAKTAEVLQAMM
ncbi:MAG TPA: hypothetical protein VFS72_04710 [Agromyces sp.]|nr:hypothetical protein [Agromyces sp.]